MHRNTTQYIISGTRFFRLASRSLFADNRTGFKGYGTNLQNIQKNGRKMYIPDEDKIFLQCDQSGAEALIVSYLTRHGLFRDLFLNGIKPHVYVGLHVFKDIWQKHVDRGFGGKDTKCNIQELCDTPISKLKKHPFFKEIDTLIKSSDNWSTAERYYYIAKQVCHSSNYNISANRFVINVLEKSQGKIVLTKEKAEYYLNFYHGMFPEIREWHDEVIAQVQNTNILYDLFGYPHYFFHKGELKQTEFKEYFACVPQGTVGLITRNAFTSLYNFIVETKVKWDILADTHDSYLVQCPITEELECAKVMTEFMNQELVSPKGDKFRMKSEVQSGYNWAPYGDTKNVKGLKEITWN